MLWLGIGLLCLACVSSSALAAAGEKEEAPLPFPLAYDVEHTGADCPKPPLPPLHELQSIASLPDPFAWSDGSGRIARRSDWRCRRAEIGEEIQHYQLGKKPDPPGDLEASYSPADRLLTVTVRERGASITLTAPVSIPAGVGPFPAVIGVGWGTGSLPPDIFTSRDIATIQYNFQEIGDVYANRGAGPFYALYPSDIGKYASWAWGISRIIDGLEKVGLNIDLSRLAVTGCSFAGKIALYTGAFDERVALTIAQEPGGGGAAAWRVTDVLSGNRETLAKTTQSWYRPTFSQFARAVQKLPYDHHELMAMVAPRALFVLGNPDYEWLAEESAHVSSMAAREVWRALGVADRFGFSIVDGHGHCMLPASQRGEVEAFVEKFLLGNDSAETAIARSPYNTDLSRWITWETPILE